MEKQTSDSGIGFCGLLTIAFIVLKLCNVIAWSWVWVLSPLWIPVALAIVVVVSYTAYDVNKKTNDRKKLFDAREKEMETKTRWQQRYEEMVKDRENMN